ncbi:MAG: histidinol dehydrogenase [Candidatus Marinimicrobia bacterium]|nr:histidinol dehydrogenase [Candidatus Neomarinimicrobiota bacterium]MCF7827581.1 histidinol dehydrogenase [Candidatus Neomarinimicrobiota bacterium]MCF7881557.1 histidinol dehydrogenase [Candidatus Neomarinimicrobiota bacterium]
MTINRYKSADEFRREFNRTAVLTPELTETVMKIIREVRDNGDSALREFTARFDGVERDSIHADDNDWSAASDIDDNVLDLMSNAAENIRLFHEREFEIEQSWKSGEEASYIGQQITPLKRVGVYVPGGTAAYPSSVLMNIIPAQVAGVDEIAIATPPSRENGRINPLVLSAARILEVEEIYAMGGAQAIAALAYGTDSIEPVDKITGPGNQYVNEAKRQVFGQVGIESLAGPSEILILADSHAKPEYLAADLLSQAEHDAQARALLISTDQEILDKTEMALESQLDDLPRGKIAAASLENHGGLIKTESLAEGIELVNEIAPEHLELALRDPEFVLKDIRNAGCVFLGEQTPEPVGDYWAGTNHILPTAGSARFASALSVQDFVRRTSVVRYDKEALQNNGKDIADFARLEGLEAHARAVDLRLASGEGVDDE